MSEMVHLHESLISERVPGLEMPSRASHVQMEVEEETLESFKSQVRALQLELEQTKAENSRLKSDVSVLQLDLKDSRTKEKALNGRVKNLIDEGSQYKTLNKEYQAEIQELRAAVYDLQRGAEQAQAHSSKVPDRELFQWAMQTRDKDFFEAVQDLQEHANSLNMQNKYITEQMTTLEAAMNEKVHVLQVNQAKSHERIHSLTDEVARLESLTEQKQAEIERLNVALRGLWNKEASLNEQVSDLTAKGEQLEGVNQEKQAEIEQLNGRVKNLIAEGSQYKSLNKEYQAEIEELRAAVYDLQCGAEQAQAHSSKVPELELFQWAMQTQGKDFFEAVQHLQEHANSLNMQNKYITEQMTTLEAAMNEKVHVLQVNQAKSHERIHSLTDEVARLESLTEQKQAEIERLNVALRGLWNKEASLNEQVSDLTAKGEQLEGVNEEKQAEIEQLTATAHHFKENEDFLRQQHDSLADELSQHESLMKSQNEKNKNLQMALHELQHFLNEAEQQICGQDELIKKQERQIEYNQQLVEELYTERADMKQTVRELKHELEKRQEEEVLAGVESIDQEFKLLAENMEKPGQSETPRDDEVLESPAAEPQAAEGQTSSWWRYCAKGLLKVGLSVGTCAASTLISNVILENLNMYNVNPMHPFCNLEPGVLRPF